MEKTSNFYRKSNIAWGFLFARIAPKLSITVSIHILWIKSQWTSNMHKLFVFRDLLMIFLSVLMSRQALPCAIITDIGLIFFSITGYGRLHREWDYFQALPRDVAPVALLVDVGLEAADKNTIHVWEWRGGWRTWRIEAGTKWLPLCRRHFQLQFPEWKLLTVNQNFMEVWSLVFNWQHVIISDNGLAQNRRQSIVWTNYGLAYWRTYVGLDGITQWSYFDTNFTVASY